MLTIRSTAVVARFARRRAFAGIPLLRTAIMLPKNPTNSLSGRWTALVALRGRAYATGGAGAGDQQSDGDARDGSTGEQYSGAMRALHWFGAAGIMFLMGSAYVAGKIPNDPEKTEAWKFKLRGYLMHNHESVGLLMLAMIVPRIGFRLLTRQPRHVAGPAWQKLASNVSHGLLYGAMIFMPISGLAFGYFSCWGVPFFFWEVPGMPKEHYNDTYKAIEAFFYENHHRVGQILTYVLFPLHVGAVAFHHIVRGHKLLARMGVHTKGLIGVGASAGSLEAVEALSLDQDEQ